jgi:hypothetical protein
MLLLVFHGLHLLLNQGMDSAVRKSVFPPDSGCLLRTAEESPTFGLGFFTSKIFAGFLVQVASPYMLF